MLLLTRRVDVRSFYRALNRSHRLRRLWSWSADRSVESHTVLKKWNSRLPVHLPGSHRYGTPWDWRHPVVWSLVALEISSQHIVCYIHHAQDGILL